MDSDTESSQNTAQSSISLSSGSVIRTNSQSSIISISSEASLKSGLSSEESLCSPGEDTDTETLTSSQPQHKENFRDFYPKTIKYCQGLTMMTKDTSKTYSTVTDVQVIMTEGTDPRLKADEFPSHLVPDDNPQQSYLPVYVLIKNNQVIALLVDNIEPGQYVLQMSGRKIAVNCGENDSMCTALHVIKGNIYKYNGSISNGHVTDTYILFIGSLYERPQRQYLLSNKQNEIGLLEEGTPATVSIGKFVSGDINDEIVYIRMINDAAKQLMDTDLFSSEDKTLKRKPKFQLRIILKPKKHKKQKEMCPA